MKKHLFTLLLTLWVAIAFGQTSCDSTFKVPPGGTYFFRSPFTRSFQSLGLDSHVLSIIMDGQAYKGYVPGRMLNDFTGFTAGHGYQIARKPISVDTATLILSPTAVFSSNAFLSGLVVPGITLTPTFAQSTLSYTASVANSVTSATIIPTLAESHATVRVNGTATASGAASPAITLTEGVNTIPVTVTAQNNITAKNYNVVITRAGPGSIVAPTVTHNAVSATGATITFSSINAPGSVSYDVFVNDIDKGNQTSPYTISGIAPSTVVNVSVTANALGYNTSVAGTDNFTTAATIGHINVMMVGNSKAAGYLSSDPPSANGNTGDVSHQSSKSPISIALGLLDQAVFTNAYNAAVSGSTVAQQTAWAPTKVDNHYDTAFSKNVLIMEGGVNSITLESKTPTQVYQELVTYYLARQAIGWSTVAETIGGSWYNGDQTGITSTTLAQIRIKQLNNLIRDGWQRDFHAIGLIDVGADAHIGMMASTPDFTYMNADGLHMTDFGYAYQGTNYEKPALQAITTIGSYGLVTPILTVPTGGIATASGSNVSLSWTAVPHSTGYNIYRNSSNTQEGETLVASATNQSSTIFTDNNQSTSSKYYFVEAVATSGYSTSLPETIAYTATTTLQPVVLSASTGITHTGTDYIGTTGITNDYTNTGVSNAGLDGADAGEIRSVFTAYGTTSNAILGLKTTSTQGDFSTFLVGYIMGDGFMNVINNGAVTSLGNGYSNAATYRIRISGSQFFLESSSDGGSTFTPRYTYPTTRSIISGTKLYPAFAIDVNSRISNPQTLNFN